MAEKPKTPGALSLRQASARLGVHHTTLRRWIQDGEGPRAMIKPGHRRSTIRIMVAELEEFIRLHSRRRLE